MKRELGGPRAVLWDMDGTLLDSGDVHFLSWQALFGQEGLTIDRAAFDATFGQRNDTVLRGFFGETFPDTEIQRLSEAKERRFQALMSATDITPLPGVRMWLARLRTNGWRQAIASSAPRANVEALTTALEIADFFGAIAAEADVTHGKPNPEVFLIAARRLGVAPERCVVVEDAVAGVAGGRAAGMRTIGVGPNHAALGADFAVRSLEDLTEDAFERLLPVGR